jgi:hypothetical protein
VITLGYSGVADSEEQGHGAFGRLIVPIPRLDLQMSLVGGMRYYSRPEFGGWGDFQKIRLEWGMHMISLFIGVGHERYATSGGRLEHGLAGEAGVSFGGPISRLRRLIP